MPSRNVIEIIIKGDDQVSNVTDKISSNLGGFAKAATVGIGTVLASTAAMGTALFELGREAAPLEGIQKAFDGIAESSGKSSTEVLEALKKGSYGMISQRELMKSYNSAAQLVGTTFANQLPDAMSYLSKVSAATGQDMGFMMDSLVKGVGRLSPMILDNLGIQVNVTEANEAYAKTLGKSADQLTKSEQQAAMMNQVLEKLKTNTAAMPDVTGSATQKWASFQTKLADFKDKIGVKLLPFFERMIDLLSRLADIVLPFLEQAVGNLGVGFATLVGVIGNIPNILAQGGIEDVIASIINAFMQMFGLVGNDEMSSFAQGIGDFLGGALRTVGDIINNVVLPAINWFLDTALPAIVNFITGTVVPAVQNFVQWLGNVWTIARPFLEQLFNWFVNDALPAIVDFVTNTVIPAIDDFIQFLSDTWTTVQPALESLYNWFVTEALPAIVDFVNNVALPAIQDVFNFISGVWTLVEPALSAIAEWFTETALPAINTAITDFQTNFLTPLSTILSGLWEAVRPGLEGVYNFFRDTFSTIGGFIQPIIDFVQDVITKAGQAIDMIRQIGGGAPGQSSGSMMTGGLPPNMIRGFATSTSSVPTTGLYMLHRGEKVGSGASGGASNPITINFMGSAAPRTQGEANDSGFMIAASLRAKGLNIG